MYSLATELIQEVASYLSPSDILVLSAVSKRYSTVLRSPWPFFKNLSRNDWDVASLNRRSSDDHPKWLILARSAIDRQEIGNGEITAIFPLHGEVVDDNKLAVGLRYLRRVYAIASEHERRNFQRFPHIVDNVTKINLKDQRARYMQSFVIAAYTYWAITSPEHTGPYIATYNAMDNLSKLIRQTSHKIFFQTFDVQHDPTSDEHTRAHLRAATYANLIFTRLHFVLSSPQHQALLPTRPAASSLYDPRPGKGDEYLAWASRLQDRWQGTKVPVSGLYAHNPDHPYIADSPMRAVLTFSKDETTKGRFSGEGSDGEGAFTMAGHVGLSIVWFVKQYNGSERRWQYIGVPTPFGWVGQWSRSSRPHTMEGDWYVWMDSDRIVRDTTGAS